MPECKQNILPETQHSNYFASSVLIPARKASF